jgi:hypothetical protein
MSQSSTQSNGHESVVSRLLSFWSDCIEQSEERTKVLLDSMNGPGDLASLRHRWLESLGKSLEAYMRTPAFLEGMRRQFDVVTHLQETGEGAARDLAHAAGIPRIDDISGLFERMQSGQKAILARLAAIEERLADLENHRKRSKKE